MYLQLPLEKDFNRIPLSTALVVRIATHADLNRIQSELFPEMTGEQEYEKRYFDLLVHDRVRCFIAEREGRLVHYSWVFLDAKDSLMAEVPFDMSSLQAGDVFIGPVFTPLTARGFIYPQVLSSVVRYLKERPDANRLVLFVRGTNLAAVPFYKSIGFTELTNTQTIPLSVLLWKKLKKHISK